MEEELLKFWQKNNTFELSVTNRDGEEHFEFYDGPPFANNLPHHGNLASSIVKDGVARYKTMRGFHVPRRFGWDCHGLPAEMKAEQDLGLGSKAGIEEYGVDKFVQYCATSVTEFTKEWEAYIDRIGRWVDFKDNFYTMDQTYMESVMWAFKELYNKGLVSQGYKVMPYCHVCETSLSHFESRQDDSYRDRVDPAVTVRFTLDTGETLLAWTTTPWTLPANLALAVNKKLKYAVMEGSGERLVLAEGALERYKEELKAYKKVKTVEGMELVGKKYQPPFDYFLGHANSHIVLHGDFVTDEDGTGIAHEAPGFGEDDQILCEAAGIEIVAPVDKQGNYTDEIKDMAGINVFDANPLVVERLKNQKTLFKYEDFKHPYPHCWRTDNPLIYKAVSSWIIDVPKIKDQLLKVNQEINWIPENVKDGAFGKWLEGARVWNVSRDRYWGTPIPVWKTDDGEELVMGSIEEIKKYALQPEKVTDLHKPQIDNVVLKTKEGKLAHRVSDVFDCWFESGAMPFAQHHYPFEGKDNFKMPADFIVEYVAQTRGWFYTLHVLSVALFGKPAFSNVISHGVILGSDGRKMSKRLGNYPELSQTFDKYGADSLRLYLFSSPVMVGETIMIDEKAMLETQRGVMMTLLNSYKFLTTYMEVDGWKAPDDKLEPKTAHILDKWIIARVHQTVTESTKYADEYDIPRAIRPIKALIEDLSNWYIRRSRRRFWKSDDDFDKQEAYHTLWYSLVRISQLIAPWAPFISEHVYRGLNTSNKEQGTRSKEQGTGNNKTSVHLTDWPEVKKFDSSLIEEMETIRELITEGLGQRAQASIKLRQPLAKATVSGPKMTPGMSEIIGDELNVKQVEVKPGAKFKIVLDLSLTEELELEGIARELIRHIQSARKKAGLVVDDRILLKLESTDAKINKAVKAHQDYLKAETLTKAFDDKVTRYQEQVRVDDQQIEISLQKA